MARKQKEPKPKSEWVDPDDAPELTAEWLRKADIHHGEVLISRGARSADDEPKKKLRPPPPKK